ncbi:PA2169 family four-helix-bundle protein [Pseudomonas sp. RIT-PI-S]|uniref:PA2169 family four-helix-bundle protein n=1 Tax=Pseudomonas sp. RIT-PI-S TaxID=3035295 RepID=UPI0021DAD730|nr:PA2169 family four-helix-bundle protein [Pseudomonas sp. RIT-PI-S]
MTDTQKETIELLNDLIQTSKNGEAGFKDLAEHTKNEHLRSVFSSRATDTAQAAAELQQLVARLGGEAETDTSLAGDLHRGWLDVKAALTGHDDVALLNEAERGEDVAKKQYSKALEHTSLAQDARVVIQKQYDGVLRNHDQIKALRDQARAQK